MRYIAANMQHLNWDNLRYVLMVANKGSIAAAARELGVNRTTVLRRINAFQEKLNCRIFEQTHTGYMLTPEAEKMIHAAREVESTLYNMQREIEGRELKLEGELRVTTTDTFMVSIMGPILASFHRLHPKIVVDVLITNSILDLNRRDADIAVRPTGSPDPRLMGRRLCDLEFGIYTSEDYLQNTDVNDWRRHQWIGLESSLRSTPLGKWFDATIPEKHVCMRCDSFVSIKVAVQNNLGAALLPCFLGDIADGLVRLAAPTSVLTIGLWVLTHPDLARSARVHAFMDHMTRELAVSSSQAESKTPLGS